MKGRVERIIGLRAICCKGGRRIIGLRAICCKGSRSWPLTIATIHVYLVSTFGWEQFVEREVKGSLGWEQLVAREVEVLESYLSLIPAFCCQFVSLSFPAHATHKVTTLQLPTCTIRSFTCSNEIGLTLCNKQIPSPNTYS
jgi:hypothetical protein